MMNKWQVEIINTESNYQNKSKLNKDSYIDKLVKPCKNFK